MLFFNHIYILGCLHLLFGNDLWWEAHRLLRKHIDNATRPHSCLLSLPRIVDILNNCCSLLLLCILLLLMLLLHILLLLLLLLDILLADWSNDSGTTPRSGLTLSSGLALTNYYCLLFY